jgi:tetratricopeptide (TPR) repeat protein
MGQLGELVVTLRTLIDAAEKNGNKLWFCAFSGMEAWVRTLAFDYQGARKLCDTVLPMCTGNPGRTPRAVTLLSAGDAAAGLGNNQEAVRCFSEVKSMTNEQFYMYWYWRMRSSLGLARTWLESGNTANARREADCFLQTVLSTADPNMQALAWEMKTRVAIAEKDWPFAEESIQAALAVLEKREVPMSAWRVHATASELYRLQKKDESAERHRAQAEAGIYTLARSFSEQEQLCAIFLAADPVRRILGAAASVK